MATTCNPRCGMMEMVPCRKPRGPLTQNGARRIRANDGLLYRQFFGPASTVYNTDGCHWYRLVLHKPTVAAVMAQLRARARTKHRRARVPRKGGAA